MNITDARGENCCQSSFCSSRENFSAALHTTLGLMKNFVKVMDKTGRGFEYVRNKFPNVIDAKIKEGIFIGPQIRKLMQENSSKKT